MNHAQLIRAIAESTGNTMTSCKELVDAFLAALAVGLQENGHVVLKDIGKLVSVHQPEHFKKNPTTGEPIKIADRQVIKFRPAKKLKAKVN
jgi:nucleoid DNA-binding protein